MARIITVLVCGVLLIGGLGAFKRALRGKSVQSKDGKTYLVIEHGDGPACGAILVDGRKWPYPFHVAGEVAPGDHSVACANGGSIAFSIKRGIIFYFDYWGP